MPLLLSNLDDRRYADLVDEARTLISAHARDWTNHNPTDPGITIIEVFAFVTEMLLYRLNRVNTANVEAFLCLLNGPGWQRTPGRTLQDEVRETVLALRRPWRAVTTADFEVLSLNADSRVARAHCVPLHNLESDDLGRRSEEKPGHVTVIIVPRDSGTSPKPTAELLDKVRAALEPARLLTTRVHVLGPRYLELGVRVTLMLQPDALEDQVRARAVRELASFLHPLTGGEDGSGWPFGRNVYVSEIYELLDTLPGVDYIKETPGVEFVLDPEASGRQKVGYVELMPDELVAAKIAQSDITVELPGGS